MQTAASQCLIYTKHFDRIEEVQGWPNCRNKLILNCPGAPPGSRRCVLYGQHTILLLDGNCSLRQRVWQITPKHLWVRHGALLLGRIRPSGSVSVDYSGPSLGEA